MLGPKNFSFQVVNTNKENGHFTISILRERDSYRPDEGNAGKVMEVVIDNASLTEIQDKCSDTERKIEGEEETKDAGNAGKALEVSYKF